MLLNAGVMSIKEFLEDPTAPILIDVRGGPETDPAIPGSISVYALDIEERPDAFIKKFAAQLTKRTLLIYCSKGDSSRYLQEQLTGRGRIQSLQGGMVSYLTSISRLLHEHPYEDSRKRGDTMVQLLSVLTDRKTDPATFRKIVGRLLQCTPNPKFKKILRS
ncbi:MAG: rhodanese-like domain-containing protein [Magnetococcales bacterium]|nr:rhodanese-like domain-containing protein [Magnetococcales bacterium]